MKIIKYNLILYFFLSFTTLVYSYEICFNQNPNKLYFYSKGYSNLCENITISKIYVPPQLKKRQVIFEMVSNITKNLKSNEIYILEFNFDESEINIEDKFFSNVKFKVEKSKFYKNIMVGETVLHYAKKFENFKKHNKVNIYINIIEPIVVSKENIKRNETLNEKNVYFIYKISTNSKKEYLSLNDLNNSNYIALNGIMKNEEIKLSKIQKMK